MSKNAESNKQRYFPEEMAQYGKAQRSLEKLYAEHKAKMSQMKGKEGAVYGAKAGFALAGGGTALLTWWAGMVALPLSLLAGVGGAVTGAIIGARDMI